MLFAFKYGNSSADVPTPPSQQIADALFRITDDWASLRSLLENGGSTSANKDNNFNSLRSNTVDDVRTSATQLADLGGWTLALYEDAVMNTTNDTIWQRMGKAISQTTLVQRLIRDTTMLSVPDCLKCM